MKTTATWTWQNEGGFNTAMPPEASARGLRLRLESGYGWVNRGYGYEQVTLLIRRAEIREAVGR